MTGSRFVQKRPAQTVLFASSLRFARALTSLNTASKSFAQLCWNTLTIALLALAPATILV